MGHDRHAGHDPGMFRRRFWLCLALTVPIVATSHLVAGWLGYRPEFPGRSLIGPALGSVVFWWAAGRSWPGRFASCATGRRG
ncbi:hypothetical protein [Micromonospora olivasterospora]|uniref:Cu2+-exporting ATPase n=1 Tax=Micromonospora olivasterospora TaxID=1880 RepID=A0A562IBC8_MICOL|nr:Cu2+-exporting ATPase [Micromonospora olivasterospora]